MATVTIKIVAKKVDDPYPRIHGLSIDEPLDRSFWNTQPDKKIGVAGGTFTYEKGIPLEAGRHTLEYGISAWAGKWTAEMYANGLLVTTGEITLVTDPYKFLSGSILVGPMGNAIPIKTPIINKSFVSAKISPIWSTNRSSFLSKIRSMTKGVLSRVRNK